MTILLIDLILAAILVLACISGYRKGFIKALIGLVGTVAALIVATVFSGALGMWINDTFAHQAVQNVISENVSSALESDPEAGQLVFGAVDRYVFSSGISAEEYVARIQEEGYDAVDAVSSELAQSISVPLCKSIAYLVLFVLASAVLRIAAHILDRIFRLPVLKTANRLLGLLLGALCGLLLVMLLSRLFVCILPWLAGNFPQVFQEDLPSKALLLRFFSEYNLFAGIVSGISDVIK